MWSVRTDPQFADVSRAGQPSELGEWGISDRASGDVDNVGAVAAVVGGTDERRAGLARGFDVWALPPETAAGSRRDGPGLRGRTHRQRVDGSGQADVGNAQQGPGVSGKDEPRSPPHRSSAGTPCRTQSTTTAKSTGSSTWRCASIEGTDLETLLKTIRAADSAARGGHHHPKSASALDAAHAAGIMHRDVKPPNVLVTRDDFAYLVDFGIASATTDEKLTQLASCGGPLEIHGPRTVLLSGEVAHRADIYALACVLYECLTGAPPYASDSAGVLVTAHMMDPIPQPSVKLLRAFRSRWTR